MRTFTVGLSLFLATFLLASSPQSPAPFTAHIGGIETLTPQEMDCIVGGEAGCGEVAGAIYDGCMDNAGVSPMEAIVASTSRAATLIGATDLGTLAAGAATAPSAASPGLTRRQKRATPMPSATQAKANTGANRANPKPRRLRQPRTKFPPSRAMKTKAKPAAAPRPRRAASRQWPLPPSAAR